MSERSGVEIDYCPTCRGVWLDRGELDKILDRAASEVPTSRPDPRTESAGYPQQQPYSSGTISSPATTPALEQGYDSRHQKRKQRSFLDDLFD